MKWHCLLVAVTAFCCGDNLPAPDAHLLEPRQLGDASTGCCALLPDQDAVRTCAGPFPAGTCGVIACRNPDGSFTRINFCGPQIDGGH